MNLTPSSFTIEITAGLGEPRATLAIHHAGYSPAEYQVAETVRTLPVPWPGSEPERFLALLSIRIQRDADGGVVGARVGRVDKDPEYIESDGKTSYRVRGTRQWLDINRAPSDATSQ